MSDNKNFSFLLFSDLHSHKDKDFNLTQANKRLIEFLRESNLPCDYLFIAGDIANQCDYTDVSGFMTALRDAVSWMESAEKKQRIFWAVGNHDIKRGRRMREGIIREIRSYDDPSGTFEKRMNDEESRTILTRTGMSEYLAAYKDVCGFDFPKEEIENAHRYFECDKLNLFVLNTCLTSCDNHDDRNLFISENRLHSLFDNARPGLPTIVIGHHGKEFFHHEDERRLTGLFQNRVDLYLCGHSHRTSYSAFDVAPHEVHQITCGGGKIDGYAKLVFMYGQYDAQSKCFTITPYSYAENGDQSWGEDFRLHSKLSKDHHTFYATRLGGEAAKPASAASGILFDKSQSYYDRLTSQGGRFAYIKHEEMLFADVKPFETTAVMLEDSGERESRTPHTPKNVIDCVLDSEENVLFVGDGGMGKTMSLLRVWQHELVSAEERKLPLYVPLNEYNIEETPRFIYNFVKDKYGIDLQSDIGANRVVLLLDGFNEITRDNRSIVSEIKDYMSHENIQVVLTSRSDFRVPYGFNELNAYHLQPLEEEVVKKYLSLVPYGYEPDMLDVLRNPMMLTLYANTSVIRERIEKMFPNQFQFIGNRTVAEILENYIICQIGRLAIENDQDKMLPTAVALRCVAPYIAHRLESVGQFSIPRERLIPLINEFLDQDGQTAYNCEADTLSNIMLTLNVPIKAFSADASEYARLLTNVQHIFLEEDAHYIFRHQYFRDYLSAAHMKTVLKRHEYAADTDLPAVLSGRVFTPNIAKMLGECLGEHENAEMLTQKTILHEAVDAMRGQKHEQVGYALYNVINIWKESRKGRIIGEDLSHLDLTHVPMNGVVFSSNDGVTRFDGASLSANSLLPMGHNGYVTSATYSPDGKRIVTASVDGTARIWDSQTGELVTTLEGHSGNVYSAAYSPDGKYIVTASGDHTARIWNSQTGELVTTLEGHSGSVYSAAYSPDVRSIVTASYDGTARIWDSQIGKLVRKLERHSGSVNGAAYSPDGKRIVTASVDGTARIWDSQTGELIRPLDGHSGAVRSAVYNPDGKCIVTASEDGTARIWDSKTGELIRIFERQNDIFYSAVYSPNGKYIITTSRDDYVHIWDSQTGELIRKLEGNYILCACATYSLNSKRIVISSWFNSALIWDSQSGEHLRTLEGYSGSINSVVYSPDGKFIATASDDDTARIWDSQSGEHLLSLEGHSGSINSVVYSPDGKCVVTASRDRTLRFWDSHTGELIKTLEGHKDQINSMKYSSDGKYIISTSDDRTVRIWNSQTGIIINTYCKEYYYSISSAVFSPGGNSFVTASNRIARVYDNQTSELVQTLEGHSASVKSVTYSPDGKHIVTASEDLTARIWDSQTGELVRTLEGHYGSVNSAAYSPDGKYIVTADDNGIIIIWDTEVGERVKSIQQYAGLYVLGCGFKNTLFTTPKLESTVRQHGGVLFRTHLERVKIKQLAHLSDLSIDFSGEAPRHLLLTGKNGSGKTALLEHMDKCLTLLKEDEEINSLSTSSVELGFYGEGDQNFTKDFRQYFLTGSMVYRYFSARHRLSDSEIKDLIGFLNGLQLQANKNASEGAKYGQILKNFEAAVKEVLAADGEVSFRFEDTEVYLCESGKKHPLDRLPHGFQVLLGIIGTLYAVIHKQGGSPETAKGLVLIDEPETHLHVAVQKRVLPLLTEVFKNIQFVVATHSPYVLNSVKDMMVFDMETQRLVKGECFCSPEECHLTS